MRKQITKQEIQLTAFETYYSMIYKPGRVEPGLSANEGFIDYLLQQPWFEMSESKQVILRVSN